MVYIALFGVAVAILDQLSKLLVVQHIPYHGFMQAIPGLFSLTYTHNTGAAFSTMEGQFWLFGLIFLVFTAAFVAELGWHKLGLTKPEQWFLAAIWGGGLGNMIDRVFRGYVVDMINLEFMTFPVFNVADCFITCGCIALMVSLLFFNKTFWKDDKKCA